MKNTETKTSSNLTKNLSYLLIGGSIGAGLALLFAPKSGSELREDISITTAKGLEKTKDTYNQLRENANAYYETAKDKANALYNNATAKVEDIVEDAKALPETAENLISDKIDQIDAAVEEGKKEYKRKANFA